VVETPVRGPVLLSAVDGRLPSKDREIMLGVSTMRAAGKRLRMQPFITPTNGPWWPKSVVIVITPEGCGALAAGIAARRRASALGACAAAIGVGHRREALRLDVLATIDSLDR